MSVYFTIFGDTADGRGQGFSATYATARASTSATTTAAVSSGCGQSLSGGNYQVDQYFGQFDTSAVPSGGGSGALSFLVSAASATADADFYEVREVSALSNKIAGASISGFTLFGTSGSSLATATASHREEISFSDITGLSRSAALKLLVHSQNERLNAAPTVVGGLSISTADSAGTTNDPYISLLSGSTWQFVGVSNVVEVTGTAHALVTTGISGLATGDLLVACISSRIASTTAITLPSGGEWTLVSEQKNNNTATNTSATPSGLMAYCIRGASDPNLTFTHPTSPSVAIGRIVAYRNAAQTSTKDTQTSFTTGTNVTAVSGTGLTTGQDDDLIVAMAAGGQEATWTSFAAATDPTTSSGSGSSITSNPAPNAWLERADSNTTTGADTSLGIFDTVKTAAGATGNLTCTASQGAAHVVVAGAFKIVAATNKTLAAGGGSYAFTGTSATLKLGRKVVAAAGAYSFTGTNATLRRNLPLVAGAGSYALTGQAATLRKTWLLTAGAGSYALTGTNASLNKGQRLTVDAGSYSLTGTNAALLHHWKLAAAAGSYVLTGTNATLRRNLPLIAGAGSYALTGTAASVLHNWKLAAGAGSYTLTGTAASVLHGWKIAAGVGAYAITGSDASLTIASSKTLVADAGSYAITGVNATFARTYRITAGAGSYSLTGVNASLLQTRNLTAGAGSYSLTGTDAALKHGYRIAAGAGSYLITGTDAALTAGANKILPADAGSYALTGTAANLKLGRKIAADAGSYTLTGTAATLRVARILAAGAGSYALNGSAATLSQARKLIAESGIYLLSGSDVTLTHSTAPAGADPPHALPFFATFGQLKSF